MWVMISLGERAGVRVSASTNCMDTAKRRSALSDFLTRAHFVQGDGGENHKAFDDLLPERRDLQQDQAVVQDPDDQAAQHVAEYRTAPATERRAANDDCGD